MNWIGRDVFFVPRAIGGNFQEEDVGEVKIALGGFGGSTLLSS